MRANNSIKKIGTSNGKNYALKYLKEVAKSEGINKAIKIAREELRRVAKDISLIETLQIDLSSSYDYWWLVGWKQGLEKFLNNYEEED